MKHTHLHLLGSLFCALGLTAWGNSAFAQTTPTAPPVTAAAAPPMAEAEVKKVNRETKKVTLKHGPIANLDMPGMTMVFQVRDAALFDRLSVGEKIQFRAEQLQGAYVVTAVEATPAPKSEAK